MPATHFTPSCLMVAAALLTGCSSRIPAPSPPPVTITIVGLSLDAADQLRRDALDEFTRSTGIRTDLIPTWGTSTDQLALDRRLLQQHTGTPDIYVIDAIWPGTLAADLLDLAPYLDASARAHWPALLENNTVGGRLVALPFYLNLGMLYYRRDLLRKYGYPQPPRTWTELETMAARIQRGERAEGNAGFWGYVWQGAAYEGLTCNALEWQASFGGGRLIEPGGSISIDNPRAVEAFRMAARWIGAISPPSVLSYYEADSLNAFRSGDAAFLRYWGSGVGPGVPVSFGVAPLPAGPRGGAPVIGGFELAISRYSAHPREAARLALFLTSSGVQLRRARRGYLPTIPQLYDSLDALAPVAALREGAWIARPSAVAGPRYAEISRDYYTSVHEILGGKAAAAPALAALQRRLAQVTGFATVAAAEHP